MLSSLILDGHYLNLGGKNGGKKGGKNGGKNGGKYGGATGVTEFDAAEVLEP